MNLKTVPARTNLNVSHHMLLDESLLSAIRADSEWRAKEVAKGGLHRWNEENLGTAWGIANATSAGAYGALGIGQQVVKGLAQQQAQMQEVQPGRLTGNTNGLTQAERTVVDDLLRQGKNVEIIQRSNVQNVNTPDFRVNGVPTELKTITGTSLNTPVTKIQRGFNQGGETVIIDARTSGLTAEQAQKTIARINGIYNNNPPGKIEIWTADGTVFGGN